MRELLSFGRWDVMVQARNGFYFASVFVALTMSAFVLSLPPAVRAAADLWVPAIFVFNLIITTFFFVTGLMLLERDEGTLTALAVTPLSPSTYLLSRIATLTGLAAVETLIIVAVGFRLPPAWPLMLCGAMALGVLYTCSGVMVASRYASVNELLLPASCVVVLLMLPLLPHFGVLAARGFVAHPIEPALALLRSAYHPPSIAAQGVAIAGTVLWSIAAFAAAHHRLASLMRDTRATGGR